MQLRELLEVLPEAQVEGSLDIDIVHLECDSRRIGPGDLFVAIRGGEERDRHEFVADALARGAGGVVVEEPVEAGKATRILVENGRRALARLAARYYQYPVGELQVVGITGTNGKTTTAFLIQGLLEAAGHPCGYVGTLGCLADGPLEKTANTTPEAVDLQRLLRALVEAGKRAVAMEVSSHALALERVSGIPFRLGVFTNLSRDHLDFHRSMKAYLEAKARLFGQLAEGGMAVVNLDDAAAPALLERLAAPVLGFGRAAAAQVRLREWRPGAAGMELDLETPAGPLEVRSQLTGAFNCHNVLAAVSCALALGIDPERIAAAAAALPGVPGRFERIAAGQDFEVIVDYAHTPDALERVLRAARELARGRLLCVFGCGGDRDRGKRPLMGRVAHRWADSIYLTSDNPRTEKPERIIADIAAGIGGRGEVCIAPDRREAIGQALAAAAAGDVVVVAGKGHEVEQIFSDRTIEFDDRRVVRQLLEGRFAGRE